MRMEFEENIDAKSGRPGEEYNMHAHRFNLGFYMKLAATNLYKNGKAYIPYLLTCIFTILMYYVMGAIARNEGLQEMRGAETMRSVMQVAMIITGIFATIFLLYTNSILIKQRKKELGLYHVLGLDKGNLARMLAWESVYTAVVSLVAGILGGIVLGKLMFLVLLKMIQIPVPLAFSIEMSAVVESVELFVGIFFLSFLWNVWQVGRTNPIELLHGSQEGEREPKTKLLATAIGILTLGFGYYIAQVTDNPLSAVSNVFFAVILVIIGTYAIFMAGSIALLKCLKKWKNYYYQTKHFTNVAGMLYRMKQNAVGLANICIMSCAVLSLISVTLSLYLGAEDILQTRYPRDYTGYVYQAEEERVELEQQIVKEEAERAGVEIANRVSCHIGSITTLRDENHLLGELDDSQPNLDSIYGVYVIPIEDYNKAEGKSESLETDEVLLYLPEGSFSQETLWIGETEWKVKEKLETFSLEKMSEGMGLKMIWLVMDSKDTIASLAAQYGRLWSDSFFYKDTFDLVGDAKARESAWQSISQRLSGELGNVSSYWQEERRESYYISNGGYLFVGVFVGTLFLVGMVLIIYYKQISEGYDDKARYQIMKKVGMNRREIKSTIHSQVLTLFFLPLGMAILHIAFAFRMFGQVLKAFSLSNTMLEFYCTAGTAAVFTLFYIGVFFLTSREYYRIVR